MHAVASRQTGRQALLLAACLLPLLVVVIVRWNYLPRISEGDYAHYLLHAKALAEGRPYGDTGYIYTRLNFIIGPALQPPGWPVLLTPVVALFGLHWGVLKAVMVILTMVFAVLAGRHFGRREGPLVGVAVALVLTLALEGQFVTGVMMSDVPFAVALWAMLYIADADGPWTWRRAVAVAALGGVAVTIRVAGVAVGPAAALYVLMRPKGDRAKAAIPLIAWLLPALAVLALKPDAIPFGRQILPDWRVLPKRVEVSWGHYSHSTLPMMLYPFPSNLANDVYHVALAGLMVYGLARFLVRWRGSFTWCFAIAYGLLIVFSPVHAGRYMWPLYPLLLTAAVTGAISVLQRVVPRWKGERATRIVFASFALIALASMTRMALQSPPRTLLGEPDVQTLFTWARETSAREPIRVVFMNPRVLTLETGVPAMGPVFAAPDRVLVELSDKKITHAIIGDLGQPSLAHQAVAGAVRERPDQFEPVYQNGSFRVYRVVPKRASDSTAAGPSTARPRGVS
jgi:hypothetical protein